jgi:RHS repeat-associated protein
LCVYAYDAARYKFTGKERDAESGLDNFGARYYGSSMGRFMTTDPLLNSGRNIWKRLDELQSRYQRKCPECGNTFWIVPDLLKTSWVDGKFEGYRCPSKGCGGVVNWNKEKK